MRHVVSKVPSSWRVCKPWANWIWRSHWRKMKTYLMQRVGIVTSCCSHWREKWILLQSVCENKRLFQIWICCSPVTGGTVVYISDFDLICVKSDKHPKFGIEIWVCEVAIQNTRWLANTTREWIRCPKQYQVLSCPLYTVLLYRMSMS